MRGWNIAIVMLAALLAGCSHLGPQTVVRDRFDYNAAISDSWKEQTLLNIVKIRYADMPLFVEVASVVSGYSLEGAVNLGRTISSENAVQGDFYAFGGTGKYTDRPTITYAPITGQHFNQSFMTPIPPRAVLFLMQTGWSVDLIIPLTVDAMNGLRAQVAGGANRRAGDPEFYHAVRLLRELQVSGAVGMHILKGRDQQETTVMFFQKRNMSPEMEAKLEAVGDILGLKPGAREIQISYGLLPKTDTELSMLTRSLLHIMIQLAIWVDVPPAHVEEGRTIAAAVDPSVTDGQDAKLLDVHWSEGKPDQAFVAVQYRGYWYWIDDRDFASKRTFAFLMILFSLMETGGREGLPLVTIPAS